MRQGWLPLLRLIVKLCSRLDHPSPPPPPPVHPALYVLAKGQSAP